MAELDREVDQTLEKERLVLNQLRWQAEELGFKVEKHTITTDEVKKSRLIVLRMTRDLSGQQPLPLTTEREHHPDNDPPAPKPPKAPKAPKTE